MYRKTATVPNGEVAVSDCYNRSIKVGDGDCLYDDFRYTQMYGKARMEMKVALTFVLNKRNVR